MSYSQRLGEINAAPPTSRYRHLVSTTGKISCLKCVQPMMHHTAVLLCCASLFRSPSTVSPSVSSIPTKDRPSTLSACRLPGCPPCRSRRSAPPKMDGSALSRYVADMRYFREVLQNKGGLSLIDQVTTLNLQPKNATRKNYLIAQE